MWQLENIFREQLLPKRIIFRITPRRPQRNTSIFNWISRCKATRFWICPPLPYYMLAPLWQEEAILAPNTTYWNCVCSSNWSWQAIVRRSTPTTASAQITSIRVTTPSPHRCFPPAYGYIRMSTHRHLCLLLEVLLCAFHNPSCDGQGRCIQNIDQFEVPLYLLPFDGFYRSVTFEMPLIFDDAPPRDKLFFSFFPSFCSHFFFFQNHIQ